MELTSKLNPVQNPVQSAALNTEKAKALQAALAPNRKAVWQRHHHDAGRRRGD